MEWLSTLVEPPIILLFVALFFIIVIFVYATIKSHKRHLERMDKINNHFGPDPDKQRYKKVVK